jgi:hypothetical protein
VGHYCLKNVSFYFYVDYATRLAVMLEKVVFWVVVVLLTRYYGAVVPFNVDVVVLVAPTGSN